MLTHWIWYATLPNISLRQKLEILEHFSDPEELYYTDCFDHLQNLSPQVRQALTNRDMTDAARIVKTCADRHIGILTMHDAAYPSRLRNIDEAPLVLYYKGILPDFEGQPVIGVVGTRKGSAYGMDNALQMSRQIAACGGLVISGGAAGIDTMALQGALDADAQTVAVLGCGVDVVYPKSNKELFAKIEENGCLLSEYLPGTGPKPWQFPARNRIISGLSNGVLVVEAPERSGALITARDAFEQGRDVFAVPGNIHVASSAGSNALLQDCAKAVFSGWDVLKEYAFQYPNVQQRSFVPKPTEPTPLQVAQGICVPAERIADKKDIDNPTSSAYSVLDSVILELDPLSRKLVERLDTTPTPVDALIEASGEPAAVVLGALTKLALLGVVENHPGKLVSVKR